jgi:hypothetical protein
MMQKSTSYLMYKRFVRYLRASILAVLLLSPDLQTFGQKAVAPSFVSNNPSPVVNSAKAPSIVIGFVGGFVRHDDTVHSPVQLAEQIRKDYPSSVYVKVFENHRREQAHQVILKLLDTNHNGTLSDEEKGNARIIIYGMSWGGSETVALARELQAEKIPVLLTIQVDSVEKMQANDEIIPANVTEAVNFYESDGFVHGRSEIRAEDPSRTKILGNFRFSYISMPADCENYPWWDRWFVKPHTEIECDPAVWKRVESLIRSKLPPTGESEIPQR